VGWLPEPAGEDPTELSYAEASARRLAARRTTDALELFDRLSNIDPATVDSVRQIFHRWEEKAITELDEIDQASPGHNRELHRRQAEALSRSVASDALRELTEIGLLPVVVAQRARQAIDSDLAAG